MFFSVNIRSGVVKVRSNCLTFPYHPQRTSLHQQSSHQSRTECSHNTPSSQQSGCEIIPISIPCATRLANAVPCSSARNGVTGADVSGRPTSQPLTAGPNLRPATLMLPMSSGVRISLNRTMDMFLPISQVREQQLRSLGKRAQFGRQKTIILNLPCSLFLSTCFLLV